MSAAIKGWLLILPGSLVRTAQKLNIVFILCMLCDQDVLSGSGMGFDLWYKFNILVLRDEFHGCF